jgi:hypothetical protein
LLAQLGHVPPPSNIVLKYGPAPVRKYWLQALSADKLTQPAEGLSLREPNDLASVIAEIVHDDDVAEPQGGQHNLFDVRKFADGRPGPWR